MDKEWQAQFDYNATLDWPDYLVACWTKEGFEGRISLFPHVLRKVKGVRTVLDVGCGSGNYCRLLKDQGFEVTGVDYAQNMVLRSKRLHPDIMFKVADGYDLPFADGSFDLAISIGTLQCLEDDDRFIGELCRVARKAVIVSTLRRSFRHHNPKALLRRQMEFESTPARLYHPDEILSLFEKHGFLAELITKDHQGKELGDCFFVVAKKVISSRPTSPT